MERDFDKTEFAYDKGRYYWLKKEIKEYRRGWKDIRLYKN